MNRRLLSDVELIYEHKDNWPIEFYSFISYIDYMTCPNCQEQMGYVNLDNQHVLHCGNCGGSFFEENSINRISLLSAQKLGAEKKTDEVFGTTKFCPKDQNQLIPVQNEESVPQHILLLRCPACHGVFCYPDDLVKFKEAQNAKINFLKTWKKPLPALRAVLVLTIFLFLSFATLNKFNAFINRFSYPSSASGLIKNFYLSKSGHYLLISFKTDGYFRSEIFFEDRSKNTFIRKVVSEQPKNLHLLTTADIDLRDEIYYMIVLTDREGKSIDTEFRKLKLE
ncbi:MAG: zf-TFIIB domain-containing protein [Microgenomates group bacterium]|nr:zf-TFIIB domain-containing protein [Microgenomates group bacterium]